MTTGPVAAMTQETPVAQQRRENAKAVESTMEPCPPHKQLELMTRKMLGPDDQAVLETHLEHCAACQQTIISLSKHAPTQSWAAAEPVDEQAQDVQAPDELREHPRYRVLSVLGRGGMGSVYKARHRLLERPVVLKVIRPDLVEKPTMVERFQREAKLAARLSHPNIVRVYEAEQLGAMQLLVMEFIEGIDLAELVSQRGLLPVAESCELIRQAAIGLEYVHEQGLVHRDIKPANLLVSPDGAVKILDLGLATLKTGKPSDGALTSDRQFLGTVDFAAPEQWESSRDVDNRADIYSLGCTLYYLLAGQSPFPSSKYSTVMQQMWAHSHAPLPDIRDLRQDVPKAVAAVVERMLAKTLDQRFTAAGEVAEALAPFVEDCDLAEFVRTARRTTTTSRLDLSSVRSSSSPNDKSSAKPPKGITRRALAVGAAGLVLGMSTRLFLASRGNGRQVQGNDAGNLPSGDRGFGPVASGSSIKVGVLHSRTGTMSISERPVIDATLLAIDEINENGGVLGRPVEAVVEDGQSDGATFAAKAEKLITQDHVCAVFGCWTSASRKTVLPVFEKHDHLLFYPVQYEGLEQSPNIVYTGAAPNQQIIPAVKWCASVLKRKRLFLVGSDYVFPRCANAIIRDTAARLDCEVVGEEYLLLSSSATGAIVQKIVDAKPDAILNTINGDSNIAFFRDLRRAGVTPDEVPTISFSISEQELSSLSAKDIVGGYAAWNYFHSVDRQRNRDFLKQFHARFGPHRFVSDSMEAAYIAVNLWAQAVEAAGSDDLQAIRQAIKHQEFDAPGGHVFVDPRTQHISKIFRVGRITTDGRFEVVFSSGSPIAPMPYPETRSKGEWDAFLMDLRFGWSGNWENPGN